MTPLLRKDAAARSVRPVVSRIWLIVLLNVVVIWVAACGIVWHGRQTAIRNWSVTAEKTALMVSAYVHKTLTASDLVLNSMLDWIAEENVQTAEQFAAVAAQRRFYDRLRQRVGNIDQIDVATFIAMDGRLLTFSRSFPPPPINLADRDYFKEQTGDAPPERSLGNVVQNRGTGRWTFYLAKQVQNRSGTPIGVVIVGVEAEYLTRFFSELARDYDGAISVLRSDGSLLATTSQVPDVLGRQYPHASSLKLASQPQGGVGYFTTPRLFNTAEDGRRLVAAKPIEGFPAVAAVSIGGDTIFATWKSDVIVVVALAMALSLAALLIGRRMQTLARASEKAMRADAERQVLDAIVEAPVAMAAVIDRRGVVLKANRRFRETFSCDAGARVPLPDFAPVLDFAASPDASSDADIQITRADGAARMLHFSLAKQDLASEAGCTILIGHDETARREAQIAIAQSAKLVTLGQMATGMAHEINQPINVIQLAAQSALLAISSAFQEDPKDAFPRSLVELCESKFQRILKQTRRAETLVSHMRVYGRTPKEGPSTFDAREVCRSAIELVDSTQRKDSAVTIEARLGDLALPAHGHGILLEQVLVNLIVNARDAASSEHGAAGKVTVTGVRSGDVVALEVADNGPGVPAGLEDRLFEPFFTTKATGKGTGLGLSISYGIVQEMGGSIRLVPSSAGAVFRVELPLANASAAPARAARAAA